MMNKHFMTQREVDNEVDDLALKVYDALLPEHTQDGVSVFLHGVPRGGVPVAMALAADLRGMGVAAYLVDDPDKADVFVDDIIASGATRDRYMQQYSQRRPRLFAALVDRTKGDQPGKWVVFPWEGDQHGDNSATDIPLRLLQHIGEDPERGGLLETPQRFLKAWHEYTAGYEQDPAALLKHFEDGAQDVREMVLVKDIPFYSHCEHHLAPFFGVAHIGYIPDGKIVGLSKLPRLVECFARRLQVQERLTTQVADAINEHLQPTGVAVVVEARHLCMESRGIQRPGATTTTSAMRGTLMADAAARAEFLQLVRK